MKGPSKHLVPDGFENRRFDLESGVFDGYVKRRDLEDEHRVHLGASDIANECPRHIWYAWRWAYAPKHDPQILRLFQRGHRMENAFTMDLRSAECIVYPNDVDGKQFEYGYLWNHCKVHLDGIALVPQQDGSTKRMIVEMKTMSEKRFKSLESDGLRKAHPDYYRQVQTQLLIVRHAQKNSPNDGPPESIRDKPIDGVIFFAENKNTDEIYIADVWDDLAMQAEIERFLQTLFLTGKAPPPIDCSENAPPCLWCDYKHICREHHYEAIEKNCRTCDHGKPVCRGTHSLPHAVDGRWECAIGNEFGVVCDRWCMNREF
ncbi:MAG: YqaJ viral recombinase family protein [Gammaproteobacteria bacterium AqS3]|nr:YqaJ viral recombinase family protein [Gammaproteobacteria bacterium AqS3]